MSYLTDKDRQAMARAITASLADKRWVDSTPLDFVRAVEPVVEAIVAPYAEAHDELVRARNYAMRQRDEERAAKEGNIRALNAACVDRDRLAEALARVEALAAEA